MHLTQRALRAGGALSDPLSARGAFAAALYVTAAVGGAPARPLTTCANST